MGLTMAEISRRGLFGLLGGVAAAPLVKALPVAPVPAVEANITYARYSGFDTLYMIPTFQRITNTVAQNNALWSRLKAKGRIVQVTTTDGSLWEDEDAIR